VVTGATAVIRVTGMRRAVARADGDAATFVRVAGSVEIAGLVEHSETAAVALFLENERAVADCRRLCADCAGSDGRVVHIAHGRVELVLDGGDAEVVRIGRLHRLACGRKNRRGGGNHRQKRKHDCSKSNARSHGCPFGLATLGARMLSSRWFTYAGAMP